MQRNVAFVAVAVVAGIGATILWRQQTPERDRAAEVEVAARQHESQIGVPAPEAGTPVALATDAPATPPVSEPVSAPSPSGPEVSAAVRSRIPPGTSLPGVGPGPEVAKRMLLSIYPDVQQKARLSEEEFESLARLLGRNARVAEYVAELGTVKYLDVRGYQESVESNRQLDMLNTGLSATGNELRDDQVRSLAVVMEMERRREGELLVSGSYLTTDPYALLAIEEKRAQIAEESDRRIVEAARSYLNEPQLLALQNLMEQRSARMRRSYEAQRSILDTPGGG